MPRPKEPRAKADEPVLDARFVFTGTVEQEGGSSLFFIPPGGTTAVVRVERIHHATPTLRSLEGQQVTVVYAENSELSKGRRLFYTNPILYGETMAVKEVRNSEPAANIAEVHEKIVRMSEEVETERLRQHIASCDAAVAGRVLSVRRAAEPDIAHMSEHDPDWHLAVIRITRSFKGGHKEEITVRFPKSRDVAWYRVPKPEEGQEAIFLLHRDGHEIGGAVLAILHPDDVLAAEAPSIRRITELVEPRNRDRRTRQ